MSKKDLFKDWIPSLTERKKYLLNNNFDDEEIDDDGGFPSFIVNRAFSYCEATFYHAYMASMLHDPKLQYDFLFCTLPKERVWIYWPTKKKGEMIKKAEKIVKIYNMSFKKALEVSDLFEIDLEETINERNLG